MTLMLKYRWDAENTERCTVQVSVLVGHQFHPMFAIKSPLTVIVFWQIMKTGWWFRNMFYFSIQLGIIIPTEEHIFQRGRYTTNQKKSWFSLATAALFLVSGEIPMLINFACKFPVICLFRSSKSGWNMLKPNPILFSHALTSIIRQLNMAMTCNGNFTIDVFHIQNI